LELLRGERLSGEVLHERTDRDDLGRERKAEPSQILV
jgi:hypothetical protein